MIYFEMESHNLGIGVIIFNDKSTFMFTVEIRITSENCLIQGL